MTSPLPLRDLPPRAGWRPGDVLVVFGELFGRGYVNGLVDAARRAGMTVVGATVGRRGDDGALRALTPEELAEAEKNLGGRIVNVPMEAGFDLEAVGGAPSPVEQLKGLKPAAWESFKLDWPAVEAARAAGVKRFEANAARFVEGLLPMIPAGANVLVVHTMAGGVPRARSILPLMTRLFRGTGEKHLSSGPFWASDLGRVLAASFEEVTALTFPRLVAATAPLRAGGRRVRYAAYGYHGCEVLIGGAYRWQSYVPYLQGAAKLDLERYAREAWAAGVRGAVFDAPEIWTNSSALFLGVEISLYPLLAALTREGKGSKLAEGVFERCRARLAPGATLEAHLDRAERYLSSPVAAPLQDLAAFPRHSSPAQMEAMLAASEELLALSADTKDPVCAELSRVVLAACGELMFHASWEPSAPVLFLGHDVVARQAVA